LLTHFRFLFLNYNLKINHFYINMFKVLEYIYISDNT